MESACEVNSMSKKDNCESQSLKNQGNIYGGWGFLLHQSSKPESTTTSKTIEFESIERSQDYCRRRSKIITTHGMLKVALSIFLILLIVSISLSIFLVMKQHVTKNHNPSNESNADHASLTPEEYFKPGPEPGYQKLGLINEAFRKSRKFTKIPSTEHAKITMVVHFFLLPRILFL